MKVAFSLALLFVLALAEPYKPKYPISVKEANQEDAKKVVFWMVHSAMYDDAWVLNPLFEDRCESCVQTIGDQENFTSWPQICNECVEPFWDKMKEMDGCDDCRHKNENCDKCHASVGALYTKKLNIMHQLAKPYFDNLHFEQE